MVDKTLSTRGMALQAALQQLYSKTVDKLENAVKQLHKRLERLF